METVVQPPEDAELHLLTEWGEPGDRQRRRKAALFTTIFHAVAIGALALAPKSLLQTPLRTEVITPLVEPLTELTQTNPNNGKVNKEFDVAASKAQPAIQTSPGKPLANQARPFEPPLPKPLPLPEPPRLEQSIVKPDLPALPPPVVPPQIQTAENPKLAFENPAPLPATEPGQGRSLPKNTAAEAIQGALGGNSGPGGYGIFVNLPPSAGTQPNNMQLLSDPMGVDFRPYLSQVLATVKRYWMAIWPESARMGRSGRVAIQFSIDRSGQVPKLVIATPSGAEQLDRAAVAAVSGSIPFAPLPREFRGDIIKLQLNFTYNLPR